MPIAGDDVAAKAQVTQLLDAIGYDTVDVGTVHNRITTAAAYTKTHRCQ